MIRKIAVLVLTMAIVVVSAVMALVNVRANPGSELSPDVNTVLLDHLNGTAQGAVYGPLTWVASLSPDLGLAADLETGTYVRYDLPSWYCSYGGYDLTGKEGTVELWINPRELPSSILTFQWNNTGSPPDAGFIFHLGIGDYGRLQYSHWSSVYGAPPLPPEGDNPTGTTVIPLNEWTHIAASWGPAGTKLYVNGHLDGYTPFIAYPAIGWYCSPYVYVYLNYWGQSGLGQKYVDELHVSRVQRTDEEILAHYEQTRPPVPATVELDPATLNLKSKGKWVTAYLELSDGHNVADIDVSTVVLEGTIPVEDHLIEISDYNNDGIPDLIVKFDRQELIEYLIGTTGEVSLTVSGEFSSGTPFEGIDAITVIKPGK